MVTVRQRRDIDASNLRKRWSVLAFFEFSTRETLVPPQHDSAADTR
jgi:hypothetical protein